MVFNSTFNNNSVISWRSVLLVEETEVPGENHQPAASHRQIYHIMLYTSPWSGFKLTTSVVIGTDCIGSCKSNYHTITSTAAPPGKWVVMYTLMCVRSINFTIDFAIFFNGLELFWQCGIFCFPFRSLQNMIYNFSYHLP